MRQVKHRRGWTAAVAAVLIYGIDTIEAIARVINRDLNPAATARVPSTRVSPTGETPDEPVPALSR